MIILPLAAVLASVILIGWLWRGDPKRLRASGAQRAGQSPARRRIAAAAAILPGVFVAATGDSPAFLIWLGACVLAGWGAAQIPERSRAPGA